MANPLYGQNKADDLIDEAAKDLKQVYRFGTPPVVVDYEHPVQQLVDGTALDTVIHSYADGLSMTFGALVAQDIDRPAASTTGMDYGYDQTNNDGIELVYSCTTTKGREGVDRFTVGNQAFSAEMEFSIATVAGTDVGNFGFRKVEALAADLHAYDEMAGLFPISGDIKIQTILNNAATTTTDTTANWADGEIHSLKVLVSKAGAVTYQIDGAAPSTTAAFSFDAGEVVTPFLSFLQASGAQTGALVLRKFTVESDNGSMEA
tara:strand:- start:901 stop:1686 length:786 start_codon:yes stop_codon:yes gene_type:complete